MKRKFVKISFVVAMAMIGGINVFNAQKPIELSDIAMAIAEKVVERQLNAEDQEALVSRFIDDLGGAL